MKYFGAHGTLKGHAPGLYIVEAPNLATASKRLLYIYSNVNLSGLGKPQEIKDEWAEVLRDTLDQIRNREKDYYTDLGNGVFYVEV